MRTLSRRRLAALLGAGALAAWLSPRLKSSLAGTERQNELIHHIQPDHLIGDVHPFYHAGAWYAYYLRPGFESRLMTSTDLLRWTEVEIRHTPPHADHPELAPYYVLNVFRDEAAGVFRTYHGWSGGVMYSHWSTDLIHWDFAPDTYRVPQQARYVEQRDPFVFWNRDERAYWCIMTCKVAGYPDEQSGAVGFASSKDLRQWEKRGDLIFPATMRAPEVPQLLQIGGRAYVIGSILTANGVGGTSCWVGDSPTGPYQAIRGLDGDNLAAANLGYDGRRWIMLGWIPLTTAPAHGRYTWAGHLALPRELYALPDGTLGVRLAPEVGSQIRGERLFPATAQHVTIEAGTWQVGEVLQFNDSAGAGLVWLPGQHRRIDLSFTCRADQAQKRFGIVIDSAEGGIEAALDSYHTRLIVTSKTGSGAPKTFSETPIEPSAEPRKCRLIVEADMLEWFVDDRYSLAARLPMTVEAARIGLFTWGGTAAFESLTLHRLRSLREFS